MATHNDLGKMGENIAAQHLIRNNYKIIERNWICNKYEIDIIALHDEYIVFVEVKTRSGKQWGNPEDAISKAKIRRIVEAADYYLNEKDIELPARFDVISISIISNSHELEHFEDAFLPPVN